MSLDGRIADARGGMDWLTPFNSPGNDFGYAEFYKGIDTVVMGRTTYEFVAAQPDWPYSNKKCFVITSRSLQTTLDEVEAVPADYDALRARILADQDQTVWIVGGGHTQRGALDAGMYDALTVFIMPVVLGGGPLIFADGPPASATLTHHEIRPGGIVELTYSF